MLSVFLIIYIVCITQYLTVECRALCSAVRGIITGNMSWSNSLRKIGQYVIPSTGASPKLLISQPQNIMITGQSQVGYGVSNLGYKISLFFLQKNECAERIYQYFLSSGPKIQQTKMLVRCQIFGDLFYLGWSGSILRFRKI